MDGERECSLTQGLFALLVQVMLGILCFASLLVKRHLECPRRSLEVWVMDTSKQAASSVCAHLSGIAIASIMEAATKTSGTNECAWYFVTFSVDTTIGVSFAYLMLQAVQRGSAAVGCCPALQNSGSYGEPPDWALWQHQMAVWCAITVAARGCCGGTIYALRAPLAAVAVAVATPFEGQPRLLLLLVMVACPLFMNIAQLWLQDAFLKAKASGPQGGRYSRVRVEAEEDFSGVDEDDEAAFL